MYKQTVKPKSLSTAVKILLVLSIVLAVSILYVVSSILFKNYAKQAVFGILLVAFFVIYFCLRGKTATYEYILQGGILTLNQIVNKRTVKQEKLEVSKIVFCENTGKGVSFCPDSKEYITVSCDNKKVKISPDKKLISYLKMSDTDAYIEENRDNILNLLKELIAIPSVKSNAEKNMPFGKECADVLEKTLDYCACLGMKTKNADNFCGWAEIGSGEKIIGIMCHLDVVPAGEGWNTDPFCAVFTEEEVFGRGAIDDKGPCTAAIYAVAAIKESFENIPVRIRLIFGCDEESGWGCMDRYLETEELPEIAFTPDAEYPVIYAEKGIAHYSVETSLYDGDFQLYVDGGMRANMVPAKAHATVIGNIDSLFAKLNDYDVHKHNLEFEAKGNKLDIYSYGLGAHGSTPEKGVNAFFELFTFIDYLSLGSSQGKFAKDFVRLFNGKTDGSGLNLNISDEISGNLSLNVGMCFIGKNDVFPEMDNSSCKTVIDIRFPVTYEIDRISATLDGALPSDWESNLLHYQQPLNMPKDCPLVKTLTEVYTEYTKKDGSPIAIGGGTYARALPGKAVAFGVQFPNREDKAHQPNESVYINDLILSGKMFACAIKKLIFEYGETKK